MTAAPPSPPASSGPPPRLAVELALLALLALFWGASYPLIKVAVATIPPVTLIAFRALVAALLLCALCAGRGDRLPRDRQAWGRFAVQACCNSILPWTLLAWAQQHVDSGLAGVLNSTSPLFVFLVTALWTRHEPTPPLKLLGALLGIAGVAQIVGMDALDGIGAEVLAQAALLAGAGLYTVAAIYGRRFSHLPAPVTATGTMIVAAVCLIPAALLLETPWAVRPSLESAAAALALAVFSTAGAFMLYFRLVRTLGSMGVSSQSYLRAGVAVLLGVVLLGETLTLPVALGVAATILGVAAINLPPRR